MTVKKNPDRNQISLVNLWNSLSDWEVAFWGVENRCLIHKCCYYDDFLKHSSYLFSYKHRLSLLFMSKDDDLWGENWVRPKNFCKFVTECHYVIPSISANYVLIVST